VQSIFNLRTYMIIFLNKYTVKSSGQDVVL